MTDHYSDLRDNIIEMTPCNNFANVAESAKAEIKTGLIIGYDHNGELCIYGGGLIDGRQPTASDWLLLVESFKAGLMRGDYSQE